jgi:hypothetical protein
MISQPSQHSTKIWWLFDGIAVKGPVSTEQFRAISRRRSKPSSFLATRVGFKKWYPIHSLESYLQRFSEQELCIEEEFFACLHRVESGSAPPKSSAAFGVQAALIPRPILEERKPLKPLAYPGQEPVYSGWVVAQLWSHPPKRTALLNWTRLWESVIHVLFTYAKIPKNLFKNIIRFNTPDNFLKRSGRVLEFKSR